jgi:hypothetical protein
MAWKPTIATIASMHVCSNRYRVVMVDQTRAVFEIQLKMTPFDTSSGHATGGILGHNNQNARIHFVALP